MTSPNPRLAAAALLAALAGPACTPKTEPGAIAATAPVAQDLVPAAAAPLPAPVKKAARPEPKLRCDEVSLNAADGKRALDGSVFLVCGVFDELGSAVPLSKLGTRIQWEVLVPDEVAIGALVENPRLTPKRDVSAPTRRVHLGNPTPGPYGPESIAAVLDLFVEEKDRALLKQATVRIHAFRDEGGKEVETVLGGELGELRHFDAGPKATAFPELYAVRSSGGGYYGECDSEAAIYVPGGTSGGLSVAETTPTFCVYRPDPAP